MMLRLPSLGVGSACTLLFKAADIPDAGQNLNLRLWAAGLGWIKASKSGQPLKRTILDASVYQPERLDFAGPPILGPGVIREPPEPQIIEGCEFLDLAALASDGDIRERATRAMIAAIEAAQPELRAAKDQWINALAPDLAQRRGISTESARQCLAQASDHGQLSGDFLLVTENGDTVECLGSAEEPDEMEWDPLRRPVRTQLRQ